MKFTMLLVTGILVLSTMFIPARSTACPCDCRALMDCYDKCKKIMPDPSTTIFCDAGCLIACTSTSTD